MHSLISRLCNLDQQIKRRASLVTSFYSAALLIVAVLYCSTPFPLSRAGSVVLFVAFAYMIGRSHTARRATPMTRDARRPDYLKAEVNKIDAQISLFRSVVYHLPFVVGANLFWMGLPGTGTPEGKALLDCVFLAATVVVFATTYVMNQRTVKRQLLPLRQELESLLAQQPARLSN
jgi:hypothetical protein